MPAKLVLIYYILWCPCRKGTIFVEITKQSPVQQKAPCSMHRILQGTKNFRVTTPIPAYRTLPINGHSLLRNVQPTSQTTLPHKSDILRPIRQFPRAAPVRNSPPNLNLKETSSRRFPLSERVLGATEHIHCLSLVCHSSTRSGAVQDNFYFSTISAPL